VPRHYDCPLTLPRSTTDKSSSVCTRMRLTLVLLLSFTVASVIACDGLKASKTSGNTIFLNRDLSTGDLSQWNHQGFGLGTTRARMRTALGTCGITRTWEGPELRG
jgi:hypothetical protein